VQPSETYSAICIRLVISKTALSPRPEDTFIPSSLQVNAGVSSCYATSAKTVRKSIIFEYLKPRVSTRRSDADDLIHVRNTGRPPSTGRALKDVPIAASTPPQGREEHYNAFEK
jgi:hypothetical protein